MTHSDFVRKTLKEAGKPLTVKQIANFSGLKPAQVRNALSPAWRTPFVNLGNQQYDLAERALKGVRYRYTPAEEELELGVLQAVDEIDVVLSGNQSGSKITLVDKNSKQYVLKRRRATKKAPFPYYRGIKHFYSLSKIASGDDLIFTLSDYHRRVFRIEVVKRANRDEQAISISNHHLADFIYNLLKYNPQRYDHAFFFYSRVIPFLRHLTVPPDHLERALAKDSRFKVWRYSLGGLGRKTKINPKWGHLIVGLSKYLFESKRHPNVWRWAVVEKDNFGQYGFCARCGIPLIPLKWLPVAGWIHPDADPMEYKVSRDKVELDPDFFSVE